MWSVLFDRSEFQFKYQIHTKWTGKNVQMFDIKKVYTYRQKCCCKCMRQWTESIYIKNMYIYGQNSSKWMRRRRKKKRHTQHTTVFYLPNTYEQVATSFSHCAPHILFISILVFQQYFFLSVQWQIFDAHYLLEYLMGLSMVNVKQ